MYIQYDENTELKKAAQGKTTKVPVGGLLYTALRDYPAIQKRIAGLFGITPIRF
jgi:hypothetical protein